MEGQYDASLERWQKQGGAIPAIVIACRKAQEAGHGCISSRSIRRDYFINAVLASGLLQGLFDVQRRGNESGMYYGRRKKSVSAHCTRCVSTQAIISRSALITFYTLCGHQSSHARPGTNGAMSDSDDHEDAFLARLMVVSRPQGGAAFNRPAISGIDCTASKRYWETRFLITGTAEKWTLRSQAEWLGCSRQLYMCAASSMFMGRSCNVQCLPQRPSIST